MTRVRFQVLLVAGLVACSASCGSGTDDGNSGSGATGAGGAAAAGGVATGGAAAGGRPAGGGASASAGAGGSANTGGFQDSGPPSTKNVLWNGGFDGVAHGDYSQWPSVSDSSSVALFFSVPEYGRPIQYGGQTHVGDGSLTELVATSARTVNSIKFAQGPTRCGDYSNKSTVKNSVHGSEPADCDGSNCERRRTELNEQAAIPTHKQGMYMSQQKRTELANSWDDEHTEFIL